MHFSEFSAAFQQFLGCQSFDYFNAGGWMNIGNTFLSQLVMFSKFNEVNKSFISQLNSKSIFNSQKSNLYQKNEQEEKIKNLFEIEENPKQLLLKIEQSQGNWDYSKSKKFSEDSILGLSCLKRYFFLI